MAELIFYVLSVVAVLASAGVILARSPMFSVISLLATFFALAVIYLLAGFQFIAAAQILVYAGAILVLFLFVIMLLNLGDLSVQFRLRGAFASPRSRVALALAAVLGTVGLVAARQEPLGPGDLATAERGIDDLGLVGAALFGRYALPFEAASVLLLVTMVAVIVLAKRQRGGTPGEPRAPHEEASP